MEEFSNKEEVKEMPDKRNLLDLLAHLIQDDSLKM